MFLLSTTIFFLVPILGIFLVVLGFFIDSKKSSIGYALMIGLFFGIVSYYFIPPETYDLFRHHEVVQKVMGFSLQEFLNISKGMSAQLSEVEFLPLCISYLVGITGNVNLLQFVIVSLGYTILFYLLYDYRKESNISTFSFIILTFFIFLGFNALNFISGLWFYLATLIFALAFYFDYIKKKKKFLCYLLYIIPVLLHTALIFPLAILVLYKFFGNKLSMKVILITVCGLTFPIFILHFLNQIISIPLFMTIERMYHSYFTQNDSMYVFYGGITFLLEIVKLGIVIGAIYFQNKRYKYKGINGFILLLSIAILVMVPQTIIMIRFCMLLQFIGIVPLLDSFSSITKNKVLYLFVILFITFISFFYQMRLFTGQSFGELWSQRVLDPLISILQ